MIIKGKLPGYGLADPLSLSFSIETERAFLENYFKITLTRTRLSIIFGVIVYGLFYLLDLMVLPDVKFPLFIIRFGLVIPVTLTIYVISFQEIYKHLFQLLNTLYMLIAGVGIVAMTLIKPQYTEGYYTGIILVLIFVYILSGLRFYWSLATGWIILIIYFIGISFFTDIPWVEYLDNIFFLVGANILLMFGGYFAELFNRREFFLQYQLNIEGETIEEVKRELEFSVMDRTHKLQKEVVERKLAQEKTQEALKQKDIVLREVYHRTKNNMGVVISLLGMQSSEQKKRPTQDAFCQISDRIYSMSLVHEQLYRSDDLRSIRFDQYIRKLVSKVHHSNPQTSSKILVQYNCDTIELGLNEAVPLGLAVNEIITNTFKHGFPAGREGYIRISMSKNEGGVLQVEVSNDGLPFPQEINLSDPGTLGLRLIKLLIQDQLQGNISITSDEDVIYKIKLKIDK